MIGLLLMLAIIMLAGCVALTVASVIAIKVYDRWVTDAVLWIMLWTGLGLGVFGLGAVFALAWFAG